MLVKNKIDEYGIPKGHLEDGESQLDAAYREIEEETTINKNQLKYVDFCSLIKYSFREAGSDHSKEVYINVFEALEKNILTPEKEQDEISEIKWFVYEDAIETLSFSKDKLIHSKEIFEKYLLDS